MHTNVYIHRQNNINKERGIIYLYVFKKTMRVRDECA